MDCYEIWVDLVPGADDLEFCDAVEAYLGHLRDHGSVESFRIRRRKFGFGPAELGEFWISIECRDLAQLDAAFQHVATRDPTVEALHEPVFSRVRNYRSALYRDFPDPVRVRS